ncbi:helix-turn-helix transcriptional regulator [Aneurinibacillus migulanus]|uniref:AraC-type DNA-binding protein n=1 Tax=Aneurinibacillus migulanus TaxID=47500 RepID=A0A1G8YM32_ANEMI|nr:AraC family transcriptional regulator [Aneurinibacillus migulanus]MED0896350.1 AraC family transcriptional regulator [Aneurinibacillus migulanus]MED1618608.1 AraC family transcriptional regulator [Aneurinibacillus migulanus]MED4729664.1 AraC family transcriptional regulator [Aneurinibacillus migulanus]SDK03777.1 AraC-type DNA-binding protein [Aneurinibacillus migulanus]GED17807.1 AraC family transcriptional regulator [Aneurinibacillus migulanus]
MNLQMNTQNLGCMIEEISDIPLSSRQREQYDQSIPILGGTGHIQRIFLRKGMEINWFDGRLHEPVTLDVGVHYPHLEISYTLSGQGCWEPTDSSRSYGLSPGVSNLVYMSNSEVRAELFPQERIFHMELRIDVRHFGELLPDLARISNEPFFCKQTADSPHISLLVEQIKQCPYSGTFRKLYLEGKAIELLVYHLDGAEKEEQLVRAASALKADDIRCLHQAKEILSHTWREPPGLLELARLVGLNDYKLKLGFKQLFGTTVFGYVRGLRMNEARKILEQGKANVSEAAMLVGYHNLSHFASLFRKTYGYNPSEVGKVSLCEIGQSCDRKKSV